MGKTFQSSGKYIHVQCDLNCRIKYITRYTVTNGSRLVPNNSEKCFQVGVLTLFDLQIQTVKITLRLLINW